MVYAYASAANNNGSAFAGITRQHPVVQHDPGLAMLVGRFLLIIPVLAIAARWSASRRSRHRRHVPHGHPAVPRPAARRVVILVGLTYFPVVALGPIVEHLAGHFGL